MEKSKQLEKPLPQPPNYRMRISRLTVDKLGIKLYDRVSSVIAELVANSYDADATKVTITAPMDELLAEKHGGRLRDKNYTIEVADNGHGMTPDEVNQFYLVVGAERRNDPRRGDTSKKFKRKVMGRKGVGKLAPLGICEQIEVISSGGDLIKRDDAKGYVTAHFTLVRPAMMQDSDEQYAPTPGAQDGTLSPARGTKIRMRKFDHRRVPAIEDFDRQIAQRFGVKTPNWEVVLRDSQKTATADGGTRIVGDVEFEMKEGTKIAFREIKDDKNKSFDPPRYGAFDEDGNQVESIAATFEYEGREYPVFGWMGYSKHPYRDDLMAGVRIYCRGKFAAKTNIFNMKAGFTGEYDVRSYLVGVLEADWLDGEEDLILTNRSDILWSDPFAQAFEDWGQRVVRYIGSLTREPMRKAAWDTFREKTQIEAKVEEEFPGECQKELREKTLDIAKIIVKSARPEELEDKKHCGALLDLALLLGPHITLEHKLTEASEDDTLEAVNIILRVARVAELASFGRIADDRVKVIKKVEELKDADADEEAFQSLLDRTPWLLNPQWSPISNNQSLTTLKSMFMEFYRKHTGDPIQIFGAPPAKAVNTTGIVMTSQFVMTTQDNAVEIIEIKKPGHQLQNAEMDKIAAYHDAMDAFFLEFEDKEVLRGFEKFHITLVCDSAALKGAQKIAFEGMKESGGLTQVSWPVFLKRTRKMHEAFLTEAERQKKNAGKR